MSININPQTAGDWGTFIGALVAIVSAIVAFVTWPYRTFLTQRAANRIYLKRLEDDGSTQYIRKQDFDELHSDIKRLIEKVDKK